MRKEGKALNLGIHSCVEKKTSSPPTAHLTTGDSVIVNFR